MLGPRRGAPSSWRLFGPWPLACRSRSRIGLGVFRDKNQPVQIPKPNQKNNLTGCLNGAVSLVSVSPSFAARKISRETGLADGARTGTPAGSSSRASPGKASRSLDKCDALVDKSRKLRSRTGKPGDPVQVKEVIPHLRREIPAYLLPVGVSFLGTAQNDGFLCGFSLKPQKKNIYPHKRQPQMLPLRPTGGSIGALQSLRAGQPRVLAESPRLPGSIHGTGQEEQMREVSCTCKLADVPTEFACSPEFRYTPNTGL